jgi:hypothetical protein
MAKKRTVANMSAEELYALAQEREQEEQEAQQAALREQIEALRAQRRELVARHKKELAAIDSQIRKLGGRTRRAGGRGRAGGNVTDQILAILAKGKATTKEIRDALESQGVTAGNLSQTLAYLKRTGRVTSPARAVYALAK